jgi:predicted double-glycine peptidase
MCQRLIILLFFLIPFISQAGTVEVNIGHFDGSGVIVRKEVESFYELRQKNVVLQRSDFSCGAASMATVFNYYLDEPILEQEVVQETLKLSKLNGTLEKIIKRRGFSLLDLKMFAESYGYKVAGYRLEFEDLVDLGVPAIVPIIPGGYKHFVVFRGADEKNVFLADPSFGNLIRSIEKFKKDWYGFTNVALVVFPKKERKIDSENHPLAVTELDKIYAGKESVDAFRYAVPVRGPFVPTEF